MGSKTFTALVLAGGLALAGCGGTNSGSGGSSGTEPIKIGMVTPLTGPFSPLGTGDKAAAEQEVKRLNAAGGILGRQVELAIVDDKTDVTQSVTEYNKLAADKSYSAILSSANVSASTAIGPSAISTKTPTLTLGPVSAFADGANPYAFTVPATPSVYAQKMAEYFAAEYFAAEGVKTLAIGYSGKDVYGKTGDEATLAALSKVGVTVLLNEPFDPAATDFTPLSLTPKGTALVETLHAPVHNIERLMVAGLTAPETEALRSYLESCRNALTPSASDGTDLTP